MEKSALFIRGQVWYWEDPIYSRKEAGNSIAVGESTMRYSRYVLIVQTTDTIDNMSVMVIPCSSKRCSSHDIPINVKQMYNDSCGYAKPKFMFPVHPKFLSRYICTVSDEVMSNIDAEIIRMILPSIGSKPVELKKHFGLDINKEVSNNINTENDNVPALIKSFVRNHLVNTGKYEDNISVYKMKELFDTYCIKNNFIVDCDIVRFIEVFGDISDIANIRQLHKSKYSSVEFRGMKVVGDLKIGITLNSIDDRDSISPIDPQRPGGKWSEENKMRFMLVYNDRGAKAAAEFFNIKQTTAQQYYYKWKEESTNAAVVKVDDKVPSNVDIKFSISLFVNRMNEFLKRNDVYSTYAKSNSTRNNYYISKDEFYKKLSIGIYYSVFMLLSIRKDAESGDLYVPTVTPNSQFLDTWKFLDELYHDSRLSQCNDIDQVMNTYRDLHGKEKGIDKEWISKLERKLMCVGKTHDIHSICSLIEFKVCSKL